MNRSESIKLLMFVGILLACIGGLINIFWVDKKIILFTNLTIGDGQKSVAVPMNNYDVAWSLVCIGVALISLYNIVLIIKDNRKVAKMDSAIPERSNDSLSKIDMAERMRRVHTDYVQEKPLTESVKIENIPTGVFGDKIDYIDPVTSNPKIDIKPHDIPHRDIDGDKLHKGVAIIIEDMSTKFLDFSVKATTYEDQERINEEIDAYLQKVNQLIMEKVIFHYDNLVSLKTNLESLEARKQKREVNKYG